MAKIYLIRHGESIANTEGKYQGRTYDTDLSMLGQKQVQALKKRCGKIKFAHIYASPLKRTIQTAAVLGKPILINEILETNHGKWEGKSIKEISTKWPELYHLWKTHPSEVQFPAGEHFRETYARSVKWLNKISKSSGNVAVVTHSNIIFCILSHALGTDLNQMWKFNIQPTCVSILNKKNNIWEVESNCQINHLDNLVSDLGVHAI